MEATLLLANSAEGTESGLVHALGLGWSVTGTPTPPAALVVLVKVPWPQTNQRHVMTLKLVDSDGHDVLLAHNAETGQPEGLRLERLGPAEPEC